MPFVILYVSKTWQCSIRGHINAPNYMVLYAPCVLRTADSSNFSGIGAYKSRFLFYFICPKAKIYLVFLLDEAETLKEELCF